MKAMNSYTGEEAEAKEVRPATFQDMGYREGGGEQVLVQFEDGHQEVVAKPKDEGTEDAGAEPTGEPAPTYQPPPPAS